MNTAKHPAVDRSRLCAVVAAVLVGNVAATSVELIISIPIKVPQKQHFKTKVL